MTKNDVKPLLNKYIDRKVCVWIKDNSERVIGILKAFDDKHLELFDEKSEMPILVKTDDYYKIENWKGGRKYE